MGSSSLSVFEYCVSQLHDLLEQGCETFASNQVIGEVYAAVQHHYDVSKTDVWTAMSDVLTRSALRTDDPSWQR